MRPDKNYYFLLLIVPTKVLLDNNVQTLSSEDILSGYLNGSRTHWLLRVVWSNVSQIPPLLVEDRTKVPLRPQGILWCSSPKQEIPSEFFHLENSCVFIFSCVICPCLILHKSSIEFFLKFRSIIYAPEKKICVPCVFVLSVLLHTKFGCCRWNSENTDFTPGHSLGSSRGYTTCACYCTPLNLFSVQWK